MYLIFQVRAFEVLSRSTAHPYQKVRHQVARLLAEVLTFDVTYHHLHKKEEVAEGDNERWSLGHGFPSTKNFIQSILPKLTLNFHNPGLGTNSFVFVCLL